MANLLKGSSPPLRWIVHPHDIADRAAQRQIKHDPHAAQIRAKVVVGKWYLINHLHIGRQRLLRRAGLLDLKTAANILIRRVKDASSAGGLCITARSAVAARPHPKPRQKRQRLEQDCVRNCLVHHSSLYRWDDVQGIRPALRHHPVNRCPTCAGQCETGYVHRMKRR